MVGHKGEKKVPRQEGANYPGVASLQEHIPLSADAAERSPLSKLFFQLPDNDTAHKSSHQAEVEASPISPVRSSECSSGPGHETL